MFPPIQDDDWDSTVGLEAQKSPGPEFEAFRDFARLTRAKRELLEQVKQIEAKLDVLDYQLREYLGLGAYKRVNVEGFTIYLRRQIYARHKDWATTGQVVEALKSSGMQQFVKEQYNSNSLSAHVRQLEDRYASDLKSGRIKSIAERLPPELANVLNVEPTYSVVAMETA
jgi:hypothetical protein